jgi:hypothetical protein
MLACALYFAQTISGFLIKSPQHRYAFSEPEWAGVRFLFFNKLLVLPKQ